MKIVVDSSILVDHLRGGMHWLTFLESVDPQETLFLPTIVLFELYAGQSSKDERVRQQIVRLMTKLQKVDLTDDIAQHAGELYRDVHIKLQAPDYIIAASALMVGAQVLTLNRKYFSQIPGLTLHPL